MYEERGPGKKPSLTTRAWLFCVKLLTAPSRPMLYSYQGSLPKLPLPSVKATLQRVSDGDEPLNNYNFAHCVNIWVCDPYL